MKFDSQVNTTQEVKEALREELEQRKEIAYLRRLDQQENLIRGKNFHNMYKEKLAERIMKK